MVLCMFPGLDEALSAMDPALRGGGIDRDPETLEAYSRDESDAPRATPGAVVTATSTEEVAAVLRAARDHGVPVTPRTGGTSRVGGAIPTAGGILLSLAQMDRIRTIDPRDMVAVVGPGAVTGAVHEAADEAGLFYAPDPNSADSCTIGGNVATNAAGPRTFKYGVTRDHVLGLEVVTGTGEILRVGRQTRKGVTGYDLTALMVGSEGTLGIVTEATVRLLPRPEAVATLLVLFEDESQIPGAVLAMATAGAAPRCVELLDALTLDVLRPDAKVPIPTSAKAMLIVEVDGDASDLDRMLQRTGDVLMDQGASDVLVAQNGSDRDRLWAARRQMSVSVRRLANHKLSEDVVVPPARLPELLSAVREIGERQELKVPAYGHAGDGNLHVNFLWDDDDEKRRVDAGIVQLFERVVGLGGTLSGEHGLGITKAPYLGLEQSDAVIRVQRQIKDVFDPAGILNPGKMFPAPGKAPRHGDC
ncbi:MAG: FAD-linked oxidase [Deltaproteobacteria bacterium]|nr:MAG: FAD-linked oxidase [Deltaproteobacteria bacterium]